MTTNYHNRKEHTRTNANQTVSQVKATTVKTESQSPAGGTHQNITKDHSDVLNSLATEEEFEFVFADDDDEEEGTNQEELTPLERQQTAALLNRLIGEGRTVADSSGHVIEEQLPYLLTLKSLIARLEVELEDEGEVDDIAFALESPEWAELDFTREEHILWLAFGLEAKEAAAWRSSGYTPYTVGKWVEGRNRGYGYSHSTRVKPEDAKYYDLEGIEAHEAAQWEGRDFTGQEAITWIKAKISTWDASQWGAVGVRTFEEKIAWNTLGITTPTQVNVLVKLGDEAAIEWDKEGVNLSDGLTWEKYVKLGYTRKELAPFANGDNYISTEVFDAWDEQKIPVDQIYTFIEKGYTPKRALTRVKKGITADKAEDLRKGEPVPGKAWNEIKASVNAAAKAEGRTVTITHSRLKGTAGVRIDINMEDPNNPNSHYSKKIFSLKFSNTGRFISAGGNRIYRGDVRKVDDLKMHIRS